MLIEGESMKRSIRFPVIFLLLIFALPVPNLPSDGPLPFSSALAQSEAGVRHKVIGCNKQPKGECVGDECSCTKWIIEWRDASGRVWGLSEAKSLQKLIESRDRDLAFERGYASFFRVPFDQKFANPSQPICDGCKPSPPSSAERSEEAAIQTGASLYDEWTRKVSDAIVSLRSVIFRPRTTVLNSPFNNAGQVLRDYANALRLVNNNLKRLRQDLSFTESQLGRLTGTLSESTEDLRRATDLMAAAYSRVPSDVRNVLERKPSVSGQGTLEVSFYSQYYGRYASRYSAGSLTVQKTDSPQNFNAEDAQYKTRAHWEGTYTAQISDLELENVTIHEGCCDAFGLTSTEGFGFMIMCKREKCISVAGGYVGPDAAEFNKGRSNPYDDNIVVSCSTSEECSNFLKALKAAKASQ